MVYWQSVTRQENSMEKLSWEAFEFWNSLSQTNTVSSVLHLIDKDMVRGLISKMKNGEAAGPTGVVSEIVKTAVEAWVDMIIDLLNQSVVEGVIPAK